jgi:hypothetical protein
MSCHAMPCHVTTSRVPLLSFASRKKSRDAPMIEKSKGKSACACRSLLLIDVRRSDVRG